MQTRCEIVEPLLVQRTLLHTRPRPVRERWGRMHLAFDEADQKQTRYTIWKARSIVRYICVYH